MCRKTKNRFTLIEMLVVVAIIAILASLMSPSLMKALEAARAVACVNNLKQCGLALTTYANDYGGWIPGSQVYANNGIPWTGMLTDVTPRCHAPVAGNYIGDVKAFDCPSAYHAPEGYDGSALWNSWRFTYGMNGVCDWQKNDNTKWQGMTIWRWTAYLDSGGANRWIHLSQAPAPGRKPLVGDTLRTDNADNVAKQLQYSEWLFNDGAKEWNEPLCARHAERCNLWFADGHVGAISPSDLGDKYEITWCVFKNGAFFSCR